MKHLFVPYSTAKLLKGKGFDELCFGWWCWINGNAAQFYDYKISNSQLIELNNHFNNCSAPLYQQAVDWLRTKGYTICVIEEYHYEPITFKYQILNLNVPRDDRKYHNKEFFYESSPFDNFKTYYEAMEFAIRFTLKELI